MADIGSLLALMKSQNVKLYVGTTAKVGATAATAASEPLVSVKDFTIAIRDSETERGDEYGDGIEWAYGNARLTADFTVGMATAIFAALLVRAGRDSQNQKKIYKWKWQAIGNDGTTENVEFDGILRDVIPTKPEVSGEQVRIACSLRITDDSLTVS